MKTKDITKIVVAALTLAGIIWGSYFTGVKNTVTNIPINSNNDRYRDIYAKQVIFNESGQIVINGIAQDVVTGDAVTWASASSIKVEHK